MSGFHQVQITRLVLRVGIAGVVLWAAFAKFFVTAGGPTLYGQWIADFSLLRWLVPGAEAVLGVWILVGVWPRISAIGTILLISAFSGLLLTEIGRPHPRPCGCMGTAAAAYEPAAIRWGLGLGLGRNVLIMAGASYLFLKARRRADAPAKTSGTPENSQAVVVETTSAS